MRRRPLHPADLPVRSSRRLPAVVAALATVALAAGAETTASPVAAVLVSGTQWGVSTCYIGATEGNVRFDAADILGAGMNTYRVYGGMSRWEQEDDDGVYGSPSIAEIQADAKVIDWAWWDTAMTSPPNGSDYYFELVRSTKDAIDFVYRSYPDAATTSTPRSRVAIGFRLPWTRWATPSTRLTSTTIRATSPPRRGSTTPGWTRAATAITRSGSASGRREGLVDRDGNRRSSYYAMRLANRALVGCRPTYQATTSDTRLLAIATTDETGAVYVLVANSNVKRPVTVDLDLSALRASGTGTQWQYDAQHPDVVVGNPSLLNGPVTFTIPGTAAMLLKFS
jgi:hypothetical protein